MPAYHHGVEVEAVRAAGARIVFYRVDRDMRIDLDDLREKAHSPDVRVVYVTHFVGFAQPIADARAIAARRAACRCSKTARSRSFRAPPTASRSAASATPPASASTRRCRCRTAACSSRPTCPSPTSAPPPLFSTLHHVAGLALAHLELHSSSVGRAVRQAARSASHATVDKAVATVKTGTMHLEPHELALGASKLVEHLLAALRREMVVVRRRRNFQRLAAALDGVARRRRRAAARRRLPALPARPHRRR